MFFELVATFAAGLATAGIVLILNHLSRGRLPRWLTPTAAGLAMIGYTVWSEYTWADRTIAAFPEGVEVVETVDETITWKPWTLVAPQVTRLIALDRFATRKNPNAPDTRLVDLYFYARWQPPAKVSQLIDCAAPARADVTDAALSDPANAKWRALVADDPLIAAACFT